MSQKRKAAETETGTAKKGRKGKAVAAAADDDNDEIIVAEKKPKASRKRRLPRPGLVRTMASR
jgi:hypothetical protein